jgi:dTDP-4-amino-4,6-dideoxygalactose transaminase
VKIPIARPAVGAEELEAVRGPIETGWLVQGPYVQAFEGAVSAYAGAAHAVATTSCSTALHACLVALGIGPGDEVLVPAFTFVATANVVEYVGARPVFVDVDLATFNMATASLADVATARTRAIIPVHLFGLAADMDAIMRFAAERELRVIEDAACAIGCWYHGRHAGTIGDAGCFSFHPRKSITTGEGGMVLTQSAALAERLRALRDHGATVSDRVRHEAGAFALPDYDMVGFNYRMTDLQGAIGVEQMKKLDWILDQKRNLASTYDERLAEVAWITTPSTPKECVHGYQSYVVLIAEDAPVPRDEFAQRLQQAGVSTRQGTHAVHNLGYYREKYGLTPESCPNATAAENRSLALPLFPGMTAEEQDYVLEAILACAE